jgi:putative tryptophan/tyrosine transport system substrate-binding protein
VLRDDLLVANFQPWGLRMKRREFIAGLGSAAGWPLLVRAQQQTKPVIGWLDVRPGGPYREYIEGFRQGLAQLGFSEGRDVTIEYHSGARERLSALTADVVRRRPAAIVALTGDLALVAKAATRDIPIIFLAGYDPIEVGLVASFNRPGGNLTGVILLSTEIARKRLQWLHEAVPTTETVALLVGPSDGPFNQVEIRQMQSEARTLGLRLLVFKIEADAEITQAFATLIEQQASAIIVGSDATVATKRAQILSHAVRFALPTMFAFGGATRAGGLLSYGPDTSGIGRQMGTYTGRILKGEKPGDLPVVRPTKFVFAINLRTAKALGLTIPPQVLAIADEVIE